MGRTRWRAGGGGGWKDGRDGKDEMVGGRRRRRGGGEAGRPRLPAGQDKLPPLPSQAGRMIESSQSVAHAGCCPRLPPFTTSQVLSGVGPYPDSHAVHGSGGRGRVRKTAVGSGCARRCRGGNGTRCAWCPRYRRGRPAGGRGRRCAARAPGLLAGCAPHAPQWMPVRSSASARRRCRPRTSLT